MTGPHGGLDILAQVAEANLAAELDEFDRDEYREGVPVDLWRAIGPP